MNKYVRWIIFLFCLFIFSFIAMKVYTDGEILIDNIIYDFISRYFISDGMTNTFMIITWFGGTIGIVLMCIISLFIFRHKKINTLIVINLIIVTVLNNLLKIIFMRVRPDINPMVIETSYAFPSGHSMISIAFYGYLIYNILLYFNNKNIKWILTFLLSILVFLIGISRIYLGVHYASDVIGGFCFGVVYLIIYIYLCRKILKDL